MSDNKIIYFPGSGHRSAQALRANELAFKTTPGGCRRYKNVPFNRMRDLVEACLTRLSADQKFLSLSLSFPHTVVARLIKVETRHSLSAPSGELALPFEGATLNDLPALLNAYTIEVAATHREPEIMCSAYRDGWFSLHSDWVVDYGLPKAVLDQGKRMASIALEE